VLGVERTGEEVMVLQNIAKSEYDTSAAVTHFFSYTCSSHAAATQFPTVHLIFC